MKRLNAHWNNNDHVAMPALSLRMEERASVFIPALTSTIAGVVFTLALVNYVRYLNATNAVEESSRVAARCVTPADPICATWEASAQKPRLMWDVRELQELDSIFVNRYRYSASMVKETWEATLPVYSVHEVREPGFNYTTYSVPTKTFRLALNNGNRQYARLQADYEIRSYVTQYRPKYIPNFPAFDDGFEVASHLLPMDAWAPRKKLTNGSYTQHPTFRMTDSWSSSQAWIPPHGHHIFDTGLVTVPRLSQPSADCMPGYSCTVGGLSGGSADWRENANLAIKAFSFVQTDPNQSSETSWGYDPPGEDNSVSGLWVDIVPPGVSAANIHQPSANDREYLNRPNVTDGIVPLADGVKRICLGGAEPVPVRDTGTNYNLYLRGPVNSHGGEMYSGVCGGKTGGHHGIAVPRGWSYRIWGVLGNTGNSRVRAEVTIKHYYDELEEVQVHSPPVLTTLDCTPEFALRRGQPLPCPALDECSSAQALQGSYSAHCSGSRITMRRVEPVCATDDQIAKDPTIIPADPAECGPRRTYAVCDTSWKPAKPAPEIAPCAIPPERMLCEWTEVPNTSASVTVGRATNCGSAVSTTHAANCQTPAPWVTYRDDGNYSSITECPLARQVTEKSLRDTAYAQSLSAPGNPVFRALLFSDLVRRPPGDDRWVCKWQPVDHQGSPVSGSLTVRNLAPETSTNLDTERVIYEHLDSTWRPGLDYFSLRSRDGCPALPQKGTLERLLSISKINSKEVSISNVYPFRKKAEFEIPLQMPIAGAVVDCAGKEASLEQRLRGYASLEIPQSLDNSLLFRHKVEFVDKYETERFDGCSSETSSRGHPHKCSPSTEEHSVVACEPGQHYGPCGAEQCPNGPEQCSNTSHYICSSTPVVEELPDQSPESKILAGRAAAVGMHELIRYLPNARTGCTGQIDCASINIEKQDEALEVRVSYNMPISFPFDVLLGKDSLTVEHRKREHLELENAGRH